MGYTCRVHGNRHPAGFACGQCEEWIADRPDPATMTPDERVTEVDRLYKMSEAMSVDYSVWFERVTDICGTAILNTQLLEVEYIRELARNRTEEPQLHIGVAQLATRMPPEKIIELPKECDTDG